jgi:hypothetical protein
MFIIVFQRGLLVMAAILDGVKGCHNERKQYLTFYRWLFAKIQFFLFSLAKHLKSVLILKKVMFAPLLQYKKKTFFFQLHLKFMKFMLVPCVVYFTFWSPKVKLSLNNLRPRK